ncbi:AAA family ATPase [Fictibacillus enclensis]|uniref:ATP-dependent nuclease n=1 Tax=Fictibacillus enclensis TaxID=1017270 RepID=UPI0025A121B8|nr:ATP-binding protein [Fictibacillus enclensis]MDM5196647.1 AAA family ATPase [Fictibacillus enclensis]
MENKVTISSINFKNYKAFRDYTLKINSMNILVGPNNSGKSTLLSAFRVLGIALKQALHKKAILVSGPRGKQYGHSISVASLPVSLENIHTDYEEIDSLVTFKLSNGNKLLLFFPSEGGCNLIPEAKVQANSPSSFKKYFPIKLEIIPVLGPLEHQEKILTEETIKQGLSTHKASRHFRNYWFKYPSGFNEFASLVASTWPGMEIELPRRNGMLTGEIVMFCRENRIPREVYWSGFGFQIWCQLLTHISRCKESTILIVDEPEVYLHPDVQRQLLGILRDSGPDIIIATHSTEIMGEADPSEILIINKQKKVAERLKDIEGVQKALNEVGSIQNITLTQLARNGRILFVEGSFDYKLIRRFAKKLGMTELASGNDITAFESEGFSSWKKIQSFAWGFKSTLNSNINVGVIFDRDYWSEEELADIKESLDEGVAFTHIHQRKEMENYLLVPTVLERALRKAIQERHSRTGEDVEEKESIYHILDRLSTDLCSIAQGQYIAKRNLYMTKKTRKDQATITTETLDLFNTKWRELHTRMEVVPGKEMLRLLREDIQKLYRVNLTDFKIIDEFRREEVPKDLCNLLYCLEDFRKR